MYRNIGEKIKQKAACILIQAIAWAAVSSLLAAGMPGIYKILEIAGIAG
jgi:hypothetical protein